MHLDVYCLDEHYRMVTMYHIIQGNFFHLDFYEKGQDK